MKKTIFSLLVAAIAISVLPSCIEETVPLEGAATSEQMAESSAAMKGSIDGMVAQTYQPYYFFGSDNQLEYDISYAGILITYARMTNDLVNNSSTIGYDWWCGYCGAYGYSMNADSARQLVPYMTFYKIIKSANDVIGPLAALEDLNAEQKVFLGTAYVYRALMYHDLYNAYLPALNKYTDCTAVEGLTVPIVVSSAEPEPATKSARAPKEDLAAFVLADLDKAETLLAGYTPANHRYPGIPVVYGIKARMYLAMEDWEHAAEYARKAIDAAPDRKPLTEAQWTDPTKAFCDASGNESWMWYYSISGNNMGNLCNPTGFLAGEADWGYNSLTQFSLQRWLYDHLNRSDFRKKSFIDPDRTTYPSTYYRWTTKQSDGKTYLDSYPFEDLPDYMCFKIRCKEGNWYDYATGGAVDWPLMRIEEMYLIEAEAIGMKDGEAAGAAKLESFMQTYRDPAYTYLASSADFSKGFIKNFQEEVLFQKRIEFLGEGIGFFDAKRIRSGIKTWYAGSNTIHDTMKYVIDEVSPYWNWVIPTDEIENNPYIIKEGEFTSEIDGVMTTLNNPDPTKKVDNDATVY